MSLEYCPSHDWDTYYDAQEKDAEFACIECAKANGHTEDEALSCDDGSVGCPDCPFWTRDTEK